MESRDGWNSRRFDQERRRLVSCTHGRIGRQRLQTHLRLAAITKTSYLLTAGRSRMSDLITTINFKDHERVGMPCVSQADRVSQSSSAFPFETNQKNSGGF